MNALEGVSLYSYGHSFTMYPAPYNTPYSGEYPERVRARLGMGKGFFRGRSGTPLQDSVPMMFTDSTIWPANGASGSREWVPNSRGVVLHQHFMNEAGGPLGADPVYREGWRNALRTAWALFSAKQLILSGTRVGAWTQLVSGADWFPGSNCWFSSTVGDTYTFNVPAGCDSVWILAAMSHDGYPTSDLQIMLNGAPHTTIRTQGLMARYTSVHASTLRNYNVAAFKVDTGCSSLAKIVTVRLLEAKKAFISGVMLPMTAPPKIFYGLEPTKNPAVAGDFAMVAPFFRQIATEVAAEFPNVTLVDLDPGWDNTTMVGSLDPHRFHPNDLGMAHIADRFCDAITATVTEPMDGVWVL